MSSSVLSPTPGHPSYWTKSLNIYNIFRRTLENENNAFAEGIGVNLQELEVGIKQRREVLRAEWDNVDRGWKELEERMVEAGIKDYASIDEGLFRSNCGGSPKAFPHHALRCGQPSLQADLKKSAWDDRLPRDADGRISLDMSPTSLTILIHARLQGSQVTRLVQRPPTSLRPMNFIPRNGPICFTSLKLLACSNCSLLLVGSGRSRDGRRRHYGVVEHNTSALRRHGFADCFSGLVPWQSCWTRASRDGRPGSDRVSSPDDESDCSVVGGSSSVAWKDKPAPEPRVSQRWGGWRDPRD